MTLTILGIETSCDETAAAVIRLDPEKPDGPGEILSNCVHSQIDAHALMVGLSPKSRHAAMSALLTGLLSKLLPTPI